MTREVKAALDGNIFYTRIDSPALRDLVRREFTYFRVKALMTRRQRKLAGGAPVSRTCIRCYEESPEGDFYIPAGMQQRFEELMAEKGIRVRWVDLTPKKMSFDQYLEPDWSCLKEFSLRPGQKEVLEKITRSRRGLIIWPTGAGKSFLIKLICLLFPKARILVTAFSQIVVEDRYRDLCQHLPQVGIYHGSRKTGMRRIMCCSAGCLPHMNPDHWHMVLVDEYYEFGTDRCMGFLSRFRYSRMFGFGANYQDRFDKADFELEGIFGRPISVSSYDESVQHGSVVPIVVRWKIVPFSYDFPDEFGVELARAAIWRNDERNQAIAEDALSYPDKQILIAVDTIEHALRLKQLLPDFEVCYSARETSKVLISKFRRMGIWPENMVPLTPAAAYSMKVAFEAGQLRKAIATSVWNRGVNFRHLEVLIRADGSASTIDSTQIPGRLSRTMDGKVCGILHDYIDGFEWRFSGPCGARRLYHRSEQRYRDYARNGWEQEVPDGIVFPSSRSKAMV